jgi:hypothetical protein
LRVSAARFTPITLPADSDPAAPFSARLSTGLPGRFPTRTGASAGPPPFGSPAALWLTCAQKPTSLSIPGARPNRLTSRSPALTASVSASAGHCSRAQSKVAVERFVERQIYDGARCETRTQSRPPTDSF